MTDISPSSINDKRRSASYPADTVLQSFEFAKKINDKFSVAAAVTREEIAHVFNVHPNTLSREIAACVQYGLIDKVEGKYKLSPLFKDIFRPENERDKRISLIKAFGRPKLYQELIEKFDNHVVPQELTNTLIKHHNITESASTSAADTFIKGGQEVGVINDNRVLTYTVALSSAEKVQYAEITEDHSADKSTSNLPAKIETFILEDKKEMDGRKIVPIYLTGNKQALLNYPDDITEDDIELVKHQIDGVLLRIKLEGKNKKNDVATNEKNKGDESPS